MVAWMLGAFAGPSALAGLAICLCRRRRRHRRLTRDQIAGSEVLAGPERHENPNRPTLDQQRPGRLPAPGAAAMASLPASPTMNLPAWVVPPGRALSAAAGANGYGPVAGQEVLRSVAADRCQSLLHVNLETNGMG
jgi:hypothetical protein